MAGQGPTGGGPAPGGAGCCRLQVTRWWRRNVCPSPWWCPSSVWSGGFGTTPSPAATQPGGKIHMISFYL